jgi:hypothetical protein
MKLGGAMWIARVAAVSAMLTVGVATIFRQPAPL